MLKIRLQRFGKKKFPIYRISVMHSTVKRDGKPVDRIGFYNPHTKELVINKEKFEHWIKVGAQMSETLSKLMTKEITHNLAEGPFKFIAETKAAKLEKKAKLKEKNTKIGKAEKKRKEKEAEAAAAATKAE
jgi:small subunit ribosomal protein S16